MKLQKLGGFLVLFLPALIALTCTFVPQVSDDEEVKKIETLLKSQDAAWNAGDLESFMQTYWKSDKMTFSSGGETRRGWDASLAQYKKSYPTQKEMGRLHFDGLETTLLSNDIAMVLGNWHLKLDGKDRDGNFSLVMKKMDGQWKIVHDHSSELDEEKDWLSLDQAETVARCKTGMMKDELKTESQNHLLKVFPTADQSNAEGSTVYVDRKSGMIHSKKPEDWK